MRVGQDEGTGVGINKEYVGAKDGKTVGMELGDTVGEQVDFPGRYEGSKVGSAEGVAL